MSPRRHPIALPRADPDRRKEVAVIALDPKYSIGIAEMDAQHARWIQLIDEFKAVAGGELHEQACEIAQAVKAYDDALAIDPKVGVARRVEQYALDQQLDFAAALLFAKQTRFDYFCVIEDQQILGLHQRRQVSHHAVLRLGQAGKTLHLLL